VAVSCVVYVEVSDSVTRGPPCQLVGWLEAYFV
jgi:hypothetical protein